MAELDYPLLLTPRFDAKIWGGRRLETVLGKELPSDDRYGESLESDTASRVQNGPLAGEAVADLIARDQESLLGRLGVAASEPFHDLPLLAKFIDATDVLSVQVHPNDEEASAIGKRGKTEAWYVIDAEPEATLITGLVDDVAVEDVDRAIHDVTLGKLVIERRVRAGDTLLVPAGTTHAIGAGVLLYEIQQASDVTYRMYDWGRVDGGGQPRELHITDSLSVLRPASRARTIRALEIAGGRSILAACRYFALERWQVSAGMRITSVRGDSFRLVSGLQGTAELHADGRPIALSAGQTALVPAACPHLSVTGDATLLVSYVPDLNLDVVEPLQAMGHRDEDIRALAGDLPDIPI